MQSIDVGHVAAFAARHLGASPGQLRLAARRLRGGLESASVARWIVAANAGSAARRYSFVVKRLDGMQQREGFIYEQVLSDTQEFAPRLLGRVRANQSVSYLFLEEVRRTRTWPWTDPAAPTRVLERLAHLHTRVPVERLTHPELTWDYESELRASAVATLEVFERAVNGSELEWLRWGRGTLRRTCQALPEMRRSLLAEAPFGLSVIHGDVHSANVALTRSPAGERAILFDWARSRVGSPLEDVASWLQSLGYWEPAAKRYHDTLLRRYLTTRGDTGDIARSVRNAYWFAAASNVFAGSLRYHLMVASDTARAPLTRARAASAARDNLRMLRRADLLWRSH